MHSNREPIQMVWLKRDLRLEDHPPLYHALKSKRRVLIVYVFENQLFEDPHYSPRHFDFIKQSISAMNDDLNAYNTKVFAAKGEIIELFESIAKKYRIEKIYAHQETGVRVTYKRDLAVALWCKKNNIVFEEKLQQGVFRGLKNRLNWLNKWETLMNQPIQKTPLKKESFVSTKEIDLFPSVFLEKELRTKKIP